MNDGQPPATRAWDMGGSNDEPLEFQSAMEFLFWSWRDNVA